MSPDSSQRFEELDKYFASLPLLRCPLDSVYSAFPTDTGKEAHSRGKAEPSMI